MKQNIELGTIREFGDIISDAVVILRQNFRSLFKAYGIICGVFVVAGILVSIIFNQQHNVYGSVSVFSTWFFLKLLFSIINYTALIVTTVSYLVLYKEKNNTHPEVMEVWGYFKYYFFRVLGTHLLLSVVLFVGFMICLVPGIYLLPAFSLVIPIMIIENANAVYSIKRAFKIIKENWWLTMGVILLLSLIVLMIIIILILVPAIFIQGGGSWLSGKILDGPYLIVEAIVINICQVMWILPVIAITLLYYTLTEQKESGSLINRIQQFGKKDNGIDQSSELY